MVAAMCHAMSAFCISMGFMALPFRKTLAVAQSLLEKNGASFDTASSTYWVTS